MKYESFKRKKIIMIGILLCVLFTAGTLIMAENQYSPVVNELKELYEKNPQFAQLLDDALKSAVVPPGGWAPDPKDPSKLFVWREKNFNDLLDFFEGWLYFVPNPSNGMSYYELFYGLCYQNECALNFVEMEPGLSWTREFVEARGEYMDKKDSIDNNKPTMDLWFKTMGDKWYDFQPLHPINEGYKGYTTFNEFFTRDIKPGKRPIAFENDETILVAPADGLTNVVNSNLSTDSLIHTKYTEYLNVEQLLDRSEYAKFFLGGTAVSTVLLPPDYHHYHSPVDGYMVESKEVDVNTGIYFGMDGGFYTYSNNGNIGGYQAKYGIFGQYHRGYYIIKTENFGYIAMIAVGLDDISSVNFEKEFKDIKPHTHPLRVVKKGQKLGHFAYGGSTVILLFQPGVFSGVKLNQGNQLGMINKINKTLPLPQKD